MWGFLLFFSLIRNLAKNSLENLILFCLILRFLFAGFEHSYRIYYLSIVPGTTAAAKSEPSWFYAYVSCAHEATDACFLFRFRQSLWSRSILKVAWSLRLTRYIVTVFWYSRPKRTSLSFCSAAIRRKVIQWSILTDFFEKLTRNSFMQTSLGDWRWHCSHGVFDSVFRWERNRDYFVILDALRKASRYSSCREAGGTLVLQVVAASSVFHGSVHVRTLWYA